VLCASSRARGPCDAAGVFVYRRLSPGQRGERRGAEHVAQGQRRPTPNVRRSTHASALTRRLTAAQRGLERSFQSLNHIEHRYGAGRATEFEAAMRSSDRSDESCLAKRCEELLEELTRNALTLGDASGAHRPLAGPTGQVDESQKAVFAACREPQRVSPPVRSLCSASETSTGESLLFQYGINSIPMGDGCQREVDLRSTCGDGTPQRSALTEFDPSHRWRMPRG
jgi:hypothetical protein